MIEMIEGSARSGVGAQSTGRYRNAGLHRSLIERSRGSRVVAYGDWTLPVVGAKQRYGLWRASVSWRTGCWGGLGTQTDEWRWRAARFEG